MDTPRPLVALMALACGVGVANVYFGQALIPLLAEDLNVSEGAAAVITTAAQVGYAAGILLIVPLGDRLRRKRLIPVLFAIVAVASGVAALTSSLPVLAALTVLIGAVTVVPQILIPMAADMFEGPGAGQAVGVLQGGLLAGILLARTFGGALGEWLGWRAPYLVAGVVAILLATALALKLPNRPPATDHSYGELLKTAGHLFRTQPGLRRSCLYQAAMFGAFSAVWTALALFITGPDYGYGTSAVGLVALVGAATVVMVPFAGRMAERRGPDRLNLICFLGLLASAVILLIGLAGGAAGLIGLVAGLLALDLAVQSSQVANQFRIFALVPGARSRLNSVYMTSVFLGGAVGSLVGVRAYLWAGWGAVCGLTALGAVIALARHLVHHRTTIRVARPEGVESGAIG